MYFPGDGGVMGVFQGVPDFVVAELPFNRGRQADVQAHDGIPDVCFLPGDGPEHGGGRVEVIRFRGDIDGEKAAGVDGVEFEGDLPFAGSRVRLYIYHVEAFFVVLLPEVHALQAAGIDHRWVFG